MALLIESLSLFIYFVPQEEQSTQREYFGKQCIFIISLLESTSSGPNLRSQKMLYGVGGEQIISVLFGFHME